MNLKSWNRVHDYILDYKLITLVHCQGKSWTKKCIVKDEREYHKQFEKYESFRDSYRINLESWNIVDY